MNVSTELIEPDLQEQQHKSEKLEQDWSLSVTVPGFAGPLDLLLRLAKSHEFDLAKISMVELVDQCIAYLHASRNILPTAESLFIVAWLNMLKSRSLLPAADENDEEEEEPSLEELRARLLHLQNMRELAEALDAVPRMDRDFFARGQFEETEIILHADVTMDELMLAYGRVQIRQKKTIALPMTNLLSMEQAIQNMLDRVPFLTNWTPLHKLFDKGENLIETRSFIAAFFCAALELAKRGELTLRQDGNWQPLFVMQNRAE